MTKVVLKSQTGTNDRNGWEDLWEKVITTKSSL